MSGKKKCKCVWPGQTKSDTAFCYISLHCWKCMLWWWLVTSLPTTNETTTILYAIQHSSRSADCGSTKPLYASTTGSHSPRTSTWNCHHCVVETGKRTCGQSCEERISSTSNVASYSSWGDHYKQAACWSQEPNAWVYYGACASATTSLPLVLWDNPNDFTSSLSAPRSLDRGAQHLNTFQRRVNLQ